MIRKDWTLLFSDYDLRSVLDDQLKGVAERVRTIPESGFASRTDEDLAAMTASELVVRPILLHDDQIEVSTRDVKIDVSHDFNRAHNPWGPTIVDGLEVCYHLPFSGDPQVLRCRPSTYTLNGARAVIGKDELRFPYDSPGRDVAATKKWFDEDLTRLKEWLGWVDAQVAEYNRQLEPAVRAAVAARRSEIEKSRADVEALGFKIRTSTSGPSAPATDPSTAKEKRSARRTAARRKYDVALSFAGEDREYVEKVADALREAGVDVFYDRYEQTNLWGKDLAEHFGHVYGQDASFVVMFSSRHYAAKAWPNHEKSHALATHLKGVGGRMLPVRFDDTDIPGVPGTIGYLDLRVLTPEQLAELVRQKIDADAPDT
ncbi:toll/interleukin-1 receptor domain-containing protein [Gemmatimonas sp. UBA7669]|uniref:toll/interleukin-1 receptor domain-containing protein n=1 Tax=Gemmatimonas sp. UBA7669 TaxID=1946568 RepID=UPI0025C1CCBF|nr:TIR domain-containing protein [Gemmatimonas sp. UBA7669]